MSKPVVPLISIRAPYGATITIVCPGFLIAISIRIPPVWGMTLLRNGRIKDDVISIHIPRGGDDSKGAQKFVGIFGKGI